MNKKPRERHCKVCGKWFTANRYARARQHVCDDPGCQHERHRRACEAWHAANPGWDRDHRLRNSIPTKGQLDPGADPRARIDWERVRDAVGPQVCSVLEEVVGILWPRARDAGSAKLSVSTDERPKLSEGHARDAATNAPASCHHHRGVRTGRAKGDGAGSGGPDTDEQAK